MTGNLDKRISAFPVQQLVVASGRLSWRESGEGVPVVLLHGISSGSASWLYQLEELSRQFHVVAWDAPGYGDSSPLKESAPAAGDYARVLHGLVGSLRQPVHLVGHSLGALIAAAYAAAYPGHVRSLALLNPAVGYGASPPDARDGKLGARLAQLRRLGVDGIARERAPHLVSPAASAQALELLRWNASRLRADGYEQAARMLAAGDLLRDIGAVRLPTLVLTGSEDNVTPQGSAREVADVAADGACVVLEGVGHVSYVEAPRRVTAALEGFFSKQEEALEGHSA